jgi:prolyl oligopeptidase PreP (S9A serine peptidase family)
MWHQRTIRGRRQRQINGALDVAADIEVVGAKRPGNVRAKGQSEEGGRDK